MAKQYKPSLFDDEPAPAAASASKFKPSLFDDEPASEGPAFNAAKLNKRQIQSRPGTGLTGVIEDREAATGLAGLITGQPQVDQGTSAARGAIQGASLGFGDEFAAFSDAVAAKVPGLRSIAQGLHDESLPRIDDPNVTYQQRRDAYRLKNQQAQQANPKTYLAGEIAGSIAAPIPGGAAIKGSTTLAKAASLAKTGAKVGALTGLGTSTADLTKGTVDELAKAANDTVKGAAIGAVAAPVAAGAAKAVGAAAGKVGKAFKSKAVNDAVEAVSQGAGQKGSATMTTKKRLAQDPEGLVAALDDSFTSNGKKIKLGEIMRQDAEKVMPHVEEQLDQIGSKFDPIFEKFNAANGGGMAKQTFNDFVDSAVAKLRSKPLQEKWIGALEDVKASANAAWGDTVPYREVRDLVTQLQKRGTKTLDTLHPGEATQVKADVASALRNFLVDDLNRVAQANKTTIIKPSEAAALSQTTEATRLANLPREAFENELAANGITLKMYRGHAGGTDPALGWFASRPKTAAGYAKDAGIVKERTVTMRRPYIAKTTEFINATDGTVSRLKKEGYDGLVTQWSGGISFKGQAPKEKEIWAVVFDHGKPDLTKDATELFKGWRTYSNTAKIRDAVEERLWKEKAGNTSIKGGIASTIGGMVGGGIGASVGGPVGAVIGAPIGAAAGKVGARKLGDLSAKTVRGIGKIYSASQGKRGAAVMDAIRAGVPKAVAMQAARNADAGIPMQDMTDGR